MHNPKGDGWASTKRKATRTRKKKKRKKKRRSRSSSNCLDEVFPPSKHRRECEPRSKVRRSIRKVSKRISSRNSRMISKMHAPRWKNSQKPIHPNNWKVKRTTYMKSSAPRFQREQKAGGRKANWIWSTSAHWRSKPLHNRGEFSCVQYTHEQYSERIPTSLANRFRWLERRKCSQSRGLFQRGCDLYGAARCPALPRTE